VLALPLALPAQDRDDHHDRDKKERVYDPVHKDYHQWNQDEDRRYREWYTETHHDKKYREYGHLDRRDRDAYWNWRHSHGDDHDHH
jgi:hypothetical protein